MSYQVIEDGGPMRNRPLSDMRRAALISVDNSRALPAEVVTYLLALERDYASLKEEHNREFLRSSWEARTEKKPAPAEAETGS